MFLKSAGLTRSGSCQKQNKLELAGHNNEKRPNVAASSAQPPCASDSIFHSRHRVLCHPAGSTPA